MNNLTNPKALLFMFAFLPQFVPPHRGSVAAQLLVLGLTQKDLVCRAELGGAGQWRARGLARPQARFPGLAGTL
jgi:threonine/homoserine/homoserine lactone efflux protein